MERRELIRQYKETPRPMGVWCVRRVDSGRCLVGSSTDVPAMLNRQRFQLEQGVHPSRALQAEWRELGAEAFAFETLDTLEPSDKPGYDPKTDLAELLAMWRERLAGGDGPGEYAPR